MINIRSTTYVKNNNNNNNNIFIQTKSTCITKLII